MHASEPRQPPDTVASRVSRWAVLARCTCLVVIRTCSATSMRLMTIVLDFGRQDQIPSVPAGARAFAQMWERAGVRHTLDEFTGGHVDRTRERFETRLLPLFGRVLSAPDNRPQ